MALRRMLAERLVNKSGCRFSSPAVNLEHSQISSPSSHSIVPPHTVKTSFYREHITSPESPENGFFRRFLQRRAINQSAARLPEFLSLPVGYKLREKLKSISIAGNRIQLEELEGPLSKPAARDSFYGVGVDVGDARKLLKLSQLEKVKAKLRNISEPSISYDEFVRICVSNCRSEEQGTEFAQLLDKSGNVIVFGNVVFLRPDQLAKSMESIISESVTTENDPRRKELVHLEKQKGRIDKSAQAHVRGELYCGLGFLVVQTLGFMRLTFWELSWDVMEPICFFVTSMHFAMAYVFFLRTSTEPSFEGYFQRRFKAKQKKLMKIHNFDEEKYKELSKLFYPKSIQDLSYFSHYKSLDRDRDEKGGDTWRYVQ